MISAATLRQPINPRTDPRTAMVLKFMTDHGRPGYEQHIMNLCSIFDEVQAEAGPNGYLCPETQKQLDDIDAEIEEVAREAVDRYDDWATDALP